MKLIQIGLLLIIFHLVSYSQSIINLSVDKTAYLMDELIWFEAEEKNMSQEIIYSSIFQASATDYCSIKLIDSEGKIWPYRGLQAFIPYKPDWEGFELQPDESRYLVKNLLAIFGVKDENHRFVFYLPVGHYSLQVELNTDYHWTSEFRNFYKIYGLEAREKINKGTVSSNIIEFDVVEPIGIEKDVHQKLLSAYELTRHIKQGSRIQEQMLPIYLEIYKDYPESVYSAAAHMGLQGSVSYVTGYRTNIKEDIIKFKDSIYSYRLLKPVIHESESEFLINLENEYPNSRLAKYIEHKSQLRDVER